MRKLTYEEISYFCEELAWMLHAGVSVGDGLHLMAQEEGDTKWKERLSKMSFQADDSIALSKILKEEECFPSYVSGLIGVGEATGKLEEALHALAVYYAERNRINKRVRSAFLYPTILMVLMLIVMLVLLTKVLPVFRSIFASLGGTMEGVAGGLYRLGVWLDAGMPYVCGFFAIVILLILAFSSSQRFRDYVLNTWRKLSKDNGVARKMNEAAIAQTMAMGLSSGLPLEETLSLTEEIMSEVPEIQKACIACREKLEEGESLIVALRSSSILPSAACRLLSLGMQSGNGDVVMQEVSERLSNEADEALEARVAAIEPILVLVTSIMVGAILLSVMLPLMNIMESIG